MNISYIMKFMYRNFGSYIYKEKILQSKMLTPQAFLVLFTAIWIIICFHYHWKIRLVILKIYFAL